MIREGQEIKYRDWMADDTLREAVSGGMDAYFTALTQGAEAQVTPGETTYGYRFMYESPNGRLYSPFLFRDMKEAFHIGEYESGDFSQGIPSRRNPVRDVDIESNNFAKQQFESRPAMRKEGFHVDTEGRGYYFWPEQTMAEDYMKAMIARTKLETTDLQPYYVQFQGQATHINLDLVYSDDVKEDKKWREVNKRLEHEEVVTKDMTYGFRRDLPYQHILNAGGFAENGGYMRLDTRLQSKHEGDKVTVVASQRGSGRSRGSVDIMEGTLKKRNLGSLVMFRVEGKVVPNVYGDGGYIMDEMLIQDEVIRLPLNDIYEQFNSRT